MSAPVGDLLAICQVASQLSKALGIWGEVSTSVVEYVELRKELDAFGNVLKYVSSYLGTSSICPLDAIWLGITMTSHLLFPGGRSV